MKLLTLLLPIVLLSCGPRGDKIKHNPPPEQASAVLVSYKPIQGTHLPNVTYFEYRPEDTFFLRILFGNESIDVSSVNGFRTSLLGSSLIGNLFTNGTFNKELYLKFTLALGTTETIEYTLDLVLLGPSISGFETIKIGSAPETKIQVDFQEPQ